MAGALGPRTLLDTAAYPPTAVAVEYVLDAPYGDDLIESFPVYLVSVGLAARLDASELTGFALARATAVAGDGYRAAYGDVPHKAYRWLQVIGGRHDDCRLTADYRLWVSPRMMDVLAASDLGHCMVDAA